MAATVRPAPGRGAASRPAASRPTPPVRPGAAPPASTARTAAAASAPPSELKTARALPPPAPPPTPRHAPDLIEPGRKRRIARHRGQIAGRLDLHGLDQPHARSRLLAFLLDAQDRGARAVLVITGKGDEGSGVLRRRTPEWLADPALKTLVAGLSPAEPQHGGAGAYYVALKRRPR